jgi:hypothetical protein
VKTETEMASILARLDELDQMEDNLRNQMKTIHNMRSEVYFDRMTRLLDNIEQEVDR